MQVKKVISFWFKELSDKERWNKGKRLDQVITDRFTETHRAAMSGELWDWRDSAEGRLAEVIVLDQFSRHIFRGTPAAFASDTVALVLAQEAVRSGADREVDKEQRQYFYMPFMHSESHKVHNWAINLFAPLQGSLKYEESHKRIIERFGRYPHRNAILGRASTTEEIEFLKQPGSAF